MENQSLLQMNSIISHTYIYIYIYAWFSRLGLKKHIFDQKNNAKHFFYDLPTIFFFRPLQETNNLFF